MAQSGIVYTVGTCYQDQFIGGFGLLMGFVNNYKNIEHRKPYILNLLNALYKLCAQNKICKFQQIFTNRPAQLPICVSDRCKSYNKHTSVHALKIDFA